VDLTLSWVAFPLVLGVLCLGCGLAVEALAGIRFPGPLVPAVGLAGIVVLGQFLTLSADTAGLTAPVVVALAVAGVGLAVMARRPLRPPGWLVAALAGVFAVYAAPIALSGDATLAGFIKLDDTATWLAFTDQVMADGRDLGGLAPSTHEATLSLNIGEGYPIGVFLPLGVGAELFGDPAWLIQPYMAFLAILLALAAWAIATPLIVSKRARAAITFISAQPALLFGYYLWGGVKELAAAALIATAAALGAFALERPEDWRRLVPLALICGALVGILSGGGAVWFAPILLGVLLAVRGRLPVAAVAERAGGFALGLGFLALPVILPGGLLPPTSSPLSDDDAKGNLLEPLDAFQAAGIWPAGDFRVSPDAEPLAYVLVALAVVLAIGGAAWAWRKRALGTHFLLAAGLTGGLALGLAGSPWVDGKALATLSPIVLLSACLGAVALGSLTRPWLGIGAGVLVAAGVLWSNALAYRDVSLAPHRQFAELEEIGQEIAGEGPTLMTEYSPYGARHFLRAGDPEAVSELRRREIPLRNGETVPKSFTADTDRLDPAALAVYRTLVLRRSPAQSRPPGAYELTWSGDFYEVWQRAPSAAVPPERLPLGSRYDPVARPRCEDVTDLARGADTLVAATGRSPVVVALSGAVVPDDWRPPGLEKTPLPDGGGSIVAEVRVDRAGEYEVWLGGSVRPSVELVVDGEPAGEVRHELNNYGQYVRFAEVELARGEHRFELSFAGPDHRPGSGGRGFPVGPVALTATEAADSRLVRVAAADARTLCGREWDWIESRLPSG
jgi:hypothetical protein